MVAKTTTGVTLRQLQIFREILRTGKVLTLVGEAKQLAGQLHPIMRESIGDLVRSMNCYYSNLIEGHDTHPRYRSCFSQ